METRFLKAGDLIQCKVRGVTFLATIEAFGKPGWLKVKPEQSWATWRWVRSNQVVEKLERQERLEVGGAPDDHGWNFDGTNPYLPPLRITADGLRALADALDRHGQPQAAQPQTRADARWWGESRSEMAA